MPAARPCPSCAHPNPEDARFCEACGAATGPKQASGTGTIKAGSAPIPPSPDATLAGLPHPVLQTPRTAPASDLAPRTDQTLLGVPTTAHANPEAAIPARSDQTILGVPAAPKKTSADPATAIPVRTDRTILGSPSSGASHAPSRSFADESQEETEFLPAAASARSKKKIVAWLGFFLGICVLGLGVFSGLRNSAPSGGDVRVRADLAPLASGEAAMDVVVDAPVGAQAAVDGQALPLDAQGHGVRRIAIAPSAISNTDSFSRSIPYRVTPSEGAPIEGALDVQIPVARLSIRTPGEGLMVDAETVDLGGVVEPGVTLELDGEAVTLAENRFALRKPVSIGQTCFSFRARGPKRVPVSRSVCVRRVASLLEEARHFPAERMPPYANLEADPASFSGRNVVVEGRVYNVAENDKRSALQILASDCPSGRRCPLWVTFPNGTSIANQARIRVFGMLSGRKDFATAAGEQLSVPQVDAAIVLPLQGR